MVTRGAWRGCCTGLGIDIRGIDIRLRVGRMEVQRRMRWRQTFMAEVAEMLQQLGLKACPVCGSMESLDIGRFPVLLVDGDFPPHVDPSCVGEARRGDMTFAVRVECITCGHLMLFNAQRYRTGDEKIMALGLSEDEESQLGE